MLTSFILTALLGLTASLPLDARDEVSSLSVRDPGAVALTPRSSSGVAYTRNQGFVVNPNAAFFAGPFAPDQAGFAMQGDGNFVTYLGDPANGNVGWASGSDGHSNICSDPSQCYLYFAGSGDLLISIGGQVLWHTNTGGKGYLVSFNGQSPYVVIYNQKNQAIWKSNPTVAPPPPPPSCYNNNCPQP